VRVTDEQVAALRALFAHELPTYERLALTVTGKGYDALFACAFVEAVQRRFTGRTLGDVVQYVADVRVRMIDARYSIDPLAAEHLIRAAQGETELIAKMDDDIKGRTEAALLDELVVDEQFDDAGLDEFLARARMRAERMGG
jgi:hypothetical protein